MVKKRVKSDLSSVNPSLGLSETDAGNSNGYFDAPSNSIVLNFDKIGDAEYIFNSVLTHEMTHSAESSQHYEALSDYVLKDIFGDITTTKGKLALDNAIKKKVSEYYKKSNGKTKLSFEGAKKEIVAQRMAEMLNNPETGYSALTELASRDLKTARGIVNTIKDTYNRIKDKLTHNEGRYYGKYVKLAKYEEAIKLFEKAVRDGAKNRGVNTNINNNVQYDIGYTTDNLPVVMLKDNIFDGKTGKPHEIISDFIADQIGNGYDISESGQKVYIGKDLPNEYTQSEYTKWILKNRSNLLKVKHQSAQNIREIIEIATDRRWDKNTKTKHNVDAKYGFYKYTSRVALPVKDSNGNIVRSNVYDIELVIRNDADGKKYLYDIQDIKKSVKQLTSTWNSKSVIQAQHSNNIVPQKTIPVNTNSTQNSGNYAYSDGDVQNNAMAEALAKAGLTNNTQNDFTDYSKYRNGDNGNTAVLDKPSDNKNGAVDNNTAETATKKGNNGVEVIGFEGADGNYARFVDVVKENAPRLNDVKPVFDEDNIDMDDSHITSAPALGDVEILLNISDPEILSAVKRVISKGNICKAEKVSNGNIYTVIGKGELKGQNSVLGVVVEENSSGKMSVKGVVKTGFGSDGFVGEIEYLSPGDREHYMSVGNQHSKHKKEALVKAGIDPLLQSKESLEKFIENSLKGRIESQIRAFSKANEQMSKDVRDATNGTLDIQDYYLELNSDDIYHLNDHINEKNKQQKPLTVDEINYLPRYMMHYDDLIDVHRQKDGRVMMVVGKRINGHSIIISIVSSGRKSLILKTAYNISTDKYDSIVKNKKSAKSQEATESFNDPMPNTSNNVPTIALSNVSITNPAEIVKNGSSTENVGSEKSPAKFTEDDLLEAYDRKETLQKDYEKAKRKVRLTDEEKYQLEGLLSGKVRKESYPQ